jgi:hypothetical protein
VDPRTKIEFKNCNFVREHPCMGCVMLLFG